MREDLIGTSPSETGECSPSSSIRPADPKSRCICANLVANGSDLPPGFRFQPTEEELTGFYLVRKATGLSLPVQVIPEIDLHKHDPWELPGLSPLPANSSQWFFFSYADRKYTTGIRANRVTLSGYWKATGRPKAVASSGRSFLHTTIYPSSRYSESECDNNIGMKKTLVFYKGRAPRGQRTPWVMHEFHLSPKLCLTSTHNLVSSEIVLCRIVRKPCSQTHLTVSES
ncbi:hypothetical protein KP509_17G043400 [Ceratopteris richardii]|uniref:NAC domain-containing protein n=1 Tax=Ceratopteris richardii TaxID=49495 RepID=A0A8T2SYU4_CERRI|nr:hypothetical protein KP509_17G043400 [Ceratopteris richardii]